MSTAEPRAVHDSCPICQAVDDVQRFGAASAAVKLVCGMALDPSFREGICELHLALFLEEMDRAPLSAHPWGKRGVPS